MFSPDAGLAGADVKALAESSDGSLWVATSLGISRLRWTGDRVQFETLTRAQGLSDRQINALAEDQGGNLWAGTEGAGLIRINRSGFTTFGDTDGLNGDRVMSIFEDHAGELIAITALPHGRALNLFDGARFRTLAPKIYASRLSPTTAGHRRRAAAAIALLPAALMRYAGQLESKQDAVVQRFLLWAIVVLFIVLIAVALYRSRSGSHLNVTPDARRAIERAKKRR